MAGYEGGYTSAINSANLRGMYQQQIEQMRQAQMRAAVQQAMEQQAIQRKLQAQEQAGMGIPGMFGPPPQVAMTPASQGSPANPMPPGVGQASVPLQRPAAPRSAPAVIPAPLGEPATPPYEAVPRPPVGFRGDQEQVSGEIGRINDPADRAGAMAQFQREGVIAPPPPTAEPAAAPAARQTTPSAHPLERFVQSQVALGVKGGALTRSIAEVFPILNAESQREIKAAAQENAMLKAQLDFVMKRALLPIKQQTADAATTTAGARVQTAATGAARADTAADQGQQRIDILARKVDAAIANAAALEPEPLTPAGMAVADELIRAGRPLPTGYGARGISRANAALNRIGASQKGGAGSGSVVAGQADYKAASAALAQNTKDLAAIRPYNEMLELNGNIAIDLASKAIATDSKLANRGMNWLRQNASDNPDVAEFLAQARIVSTEAARVLNNPRLVGQLTDTARKEMESVISGDMPLNAFVRVMKRMQADGRNRVSTMEKEQERLRGDTGGGNQPIPSSAVAGRRAGDNAGAGVEYNGYRFPTQEALDAYKAAGGK